MTDPRPPGAAGEPPLARAAVFPEPELPDAAALVARGRALARTVTVGACPFLEHYGVACENDHKRRAMAEGRVMLHAQIGYRDLAKSRRAWAEIHARTAAAGRAVERYGVCLDFSMGYPPAERARRPRGTGLILERPEDFAALTGMAPVAPHFGDFVLGTPAAVENTSAALLAGATAIGNLGQYCTFRLPHWEDDVATTAATVTALALIAAQPVEVAVHSNLDDGFASLMTDLASVLGMVLIERHIVEGLIGGRVAHCYGHSFSRPLTRMAFQHALAEASSGPGTMIYGNTTIYGEGERANFAGLASYLLVDILAQQRRPSGHAINAVPVTEAERIPDIDEVVEAQRFAARLIERSDGWQALLDPAPVEATAARILDGGRAFRDRALAGLAEAGIDTADPFEMLLALRRFGPRRLERLFGQGEPDAGRPGGRRPLVEATTIGELERLAEKTAAGLAPAARAAIAAAGLRACVATSDVHEFGKILLDGTLRRLGVDLLDAGVSSDPETVARAAEAGRADFIAVSTYNGVALDYLTALKAALGALRLDIPVFIGGRLNQLPAASNSSLPVDVGEELAAAGAIVCRRVEDMLDGLAALARRRPPAA
jgi:hypothetical protein